MQVRVAKTAGFCFGVRRAVEMVAREAAAGSGAVTLGPIIHNRHVVEEFAAQGVRPVETPADAPEGGTVIIRSHGVGRAVYDELAARHCRVLDATCPFVKRIHTIVAQAEQAGRRSIIIGTRTHPEVLAIAGWCDDPLIFESATELENWLFRGPAAAQFAACDGLSDHFHKIFVEFLR